MFFLPRHKFRRRMGLGQNLTDLKAQEEKHEQEQDEGYYPQEPQEPPEVQAMKDKLKRMTAYHADDYDVAESDLHSELVLATTKSQFVLEQIMSWIMSILIGIVIGCLGTGFNLCIAALTRVRYDTTMKFIHPGGGWWKPWLVSIAFSTLYALVAGFLGSYFSPQAGGSGISDIRAYLNGIHIRNLLSIRTLIAKSFGVSFAIASGLVAGKEGPYIHIGAILGGGLANMGSESVIRWTGGKVRAKLRRRLSSYFRQPIEHRDYVAVGCAAGIATAFGAPIGGVVFAIEQVSSFFSPNMLWHAAVAAGIALYITLVWMGVDVDPGNLWTAHFGNPLDFVVKGGVVNTVAIYYYTPWELLIFMLMGLVGGLMGALLVPMNEILFRVRRRFVPRTRPFRRMMEVVFYSVIATTIWFFLSYASPCADNPVFDQTPDTPAEASGISASNGHFKARSSGNMYEQLWCLDEGQHSEYGVLFFTPLANALARVYANPALQGSPDDKGQERKISSEEILYSSVALGCLFVLTYLFMNATYGIGAAAGIFVPTLLSGAAGGRLVGRIVRASLVSQGAHPGKYKVSLAAYAVVGSGAMLGGVSRMLLSTVVIIMETSGAENLTIPLIIASAVGKIVADFITIGIYNTNMERHAYPFLPEQPEGLEALKLSHQLQVADVMTPKIVAMPVVIRIREMVAFLKTHPFNTIPLVTPDRRALQEALAAQHQQQAVKQERLLQNLVNQHEQKGLRVQEERDRFTCPPKLPTYTERPLNGPATKDVHSSQFQQGSGADNRITPHAVTKRASSESDRPGGVGPRGKRGLRPGLWGPYSPQPHHRYQQQGVQNSVAPEPGSLPLGHCSSPSGIAGSGPRAPVFGGCLPPPGHSSGPPQGPDSPGALLGPHPQGPNSPGAPLGPPTQGPNSPGTPLGEGPPTQGPNSPGAPLGEGFVHEGDWDAARFGGEAAQGGVSDYARIMAGLAEHGVGDRAREHGWEIPRSGSDIAEGRVREGEWDAARSSSNSPGGRVHEWETPQWGSGVAEGRVREGEWDAARLGFGGEGQRRQTRGSTEEEGSHGGHPGRQSRGHVTQQSMGSTVEEGDHRGYAARPDAAEARAGDGYAKLLPYGSALSSAAAAPESPPASRTSLPRATSHSHLSLDKVGQHGRAPRPHSTAGGPVPRDGPAQPHVSTALHRRPHSSNQRHSAHGPALGAVLGAPSHRASSAQQLPLPFSASMPRSSNTHYSMAQQPIPRTSASMPRRSNSGNMRSQAVPPPPPSILQRLESQRPGPSQVTASLASAAEAAVRRIGGTGGGGGGGAGERVGGGILGLSRTSSGSSSAGGGGLSGVGVLSALVGGKHGKHGMGEALFPTPQGALRAALSQQRDVSKQAATRLQAVQQEDDLRVQPSSSGGAFTHQQLPPPRSPSLSNRASAFGAGHSSSESLFRPSLPPAAAQHAHHVQRSSLGPGCVTPPEHTLLSSLPPKPSAGVLGPNLGVGDGALYRDTRDRGSTSPPEFDSSMQGDDWPVTAGGSLPEDSYMQGMGRGDRASMPQPRSGSASAVTRNKRTSSGSDGAFQPRGRQSLSQGNSHNLPSMHQSDPRLQPSALLSQSTSRKPSASNLLDTRSSVGVMQPASGPLKKGMLDTNSAFLAHPGPTPFNTLHSPGHAGTSGDLFPIPSGRLGFHATSLPQTDSEDEAPQPYLSSKAPSQRLSMDPGTVITPSSAPVLNLPPRGGSLQSNPSAASGVAAAASAAAATANYQRHSWGNEGGNEVKKGISEAGNSTGTDGSSDSVDIVGVISRSTLLNILQVRQGFYRSFRDAAEEEETGGKQGQKGVPSIREALASLETNTVKPPTTAEEQEKLFQSLSEAELDSCINLRHHMQRVPYTVPANASLARAYRLFRTLGLHHLFVTAGQVPVVGLMTRSDLVPGAPEVAMYHKMEAALSAAVTAAEAAKDADEVRSGANASNNHHTSSHHHPRRSAASISAAHYAATATRGGIAAASPAFTDVDVSVHGSTAASAREPVGSRVQYTSSMRLPRHQPHAQHPHALQPHSHHGYPLLHHQRSSLQPYFHQEQPLLHQQPSSPPLRPHRITSPEGLSGRRREGEERHTHNGVHSPLVSVVAPAIAGKDPPCMPGAALPKAHSDLPTIPCSDGQPSPKEPSRRGSSEVLLLQDFEGRTMSSVGGNEGLQGPLPRASFAHAGKEPGTEGPKGDLDLSMRGGIMGTGDAPCNGGSESKGGRAVGGAHAALQAAVAADGTGGDAGAGGQQEPVVPSLSRPISLNLGRRQQQQQLEQQQQRQHMQQQQQQQQQQPIACAACRDGHWQQQQQHSCPRTTASGGLGSGPILSSSGMSMGLGFPWGVGDTRSREGGEAGGSLAQTQANTSVPLLGAAPGATAHDSHWGPSSSCGSLYGLSNSNMLLAMPPLQQEQQQQPNSDGNLPQQEHHVVHVGPEQVEVCSDGGGAVLDAGARFCRSSTGSSASLDQADQRPSRQNPRTVQQRQHDAQLAFLKEQMEHMMQSKGDSSVSALVEEAFLPNLEEELEALEEETDGFAQRQQRPTQQQDWEDMVSLAAVDEQQQEGEVEGADGWEGEQEGMGWEDVHELPVAPVQNQRACSAGGSYVESEGMDCQ